MSGDATRPSAPEEGRDAPTREGDGLLGSGRMDIDLAIEPEHHDLRCPRPLGMSSWRYHLCPECGHTVDTFGGNVD